MTPQSDTLGGSVTVVLPSITGIDSDGLESAVRSKLEKASDYRDAARASGADELWLVLLAAGTSATNLVADNVVITLTQERRKRLLQSNPGFDRVYLLARADWATAREWGVVGIHP